MSTISKIKLMLAAVIILFVTAAVYISALVVKRQEVLEQVTRYNVAFLLSQAATEHARFEQRLSAYGAGEVSNDEVQLRDLLDRIDAAFAASRDAVEAAMSEHLIRQG